MKILKIPPQTIPYTPSFMPLFMIPRVAGQYYGPIGAGANIGGITATANKILFAPFIVFNTESFDRIALNIQTGAVGTARLGIYNNADFKPTTLVLDAGEIDTSTTGNKEIMINTQLTPGIWWLACLFSATPGFRSFASLNVFGLPVYDLDAGTSPTYWAAQAYGALPETTPAPALNTQLPAVCLRRS